jgi:hypothetical protein
LYAPDDAGAYDTPASIEKLSSSDIDGFATVISELFVLGSVTAACLVLATTAAALSPETTVRPTLVLVADAPISFAGRGFAPRERVTVRLTWNGAGLGRQTVANRAGSFLVRFPGAARNECEPAVGVATGSAGSRAASRKIAIPPPCGTAPQR